MDRGRDAEAVTVAQRIGENDEMTDEMTMDTDRQHHETTSQSVTAVAETSDDAPASGPTHGHGPSYADDKAKILSRLRRIEGQVRGVERMVEADQYCVDVLTQMSSIISALRATGLLVLEDHIRGCVVGADEDDQEAVLDELNGAIERFVRSVS